jgi:hypothetical protein
MSGINHRHQAHGASFDNRERLDGFLAQHQHVKRIAVLGQRLRNKSVIRRIGSFPTTPR